ncbi:hypothetical protein [Streptomyces doebereineriae]|uniref:Uncharacterized protein n=1 Tax=Streptomyces doebereineriae TaxID=3075528 RepID=A0ABU2VG06_9ACTN|nr:hypothetical protein [Streptomyces sp. DSM 41640]MDT0484515.1 hypothetical protein [Streptomyces sp. DSM 41640]
MPTHRLTEVPVDALKEIESLAGPVLDIEMLSAGHNSEIAARSHFTEGTAFVKGLRQDHPRVWTQQREADINPHTYGFAPAMRGTSRSSSDWPDGVSPAYDSPCFLVRTARGSGPCSVSRPPEPPSESGTLALP